MKDWRGGAIVSVAGVIASIHAVPALAQSIQAVRGGNTLVTVNTGAPGTVTRSTVVTGLGAGQTISAIDYRPAAPRILYAISNVGQIYTFNSRTGVATAGGTPPLPTISGVGFDFNPTVDRLRIVNQAGQKVGASPDTGALAATDGAHGNWGHEFLDRAQFITAGFINPGLSTTPFSFVATPLDTDYYSAGATINIAGNDPLLIVADYNVQLDKDRQLHAFMVGGRLAF